MSFKKLNGCDESLKTSVPSEKDQVSSAFSRTWKSLGLGSILAGVAIALVGVAFLTKFKCFNLLTQNQSYIVIGSGVIPPIFYAFCVGVAKKGKHFSKELDAEASDSLSKNEIPLPQKIQKPRYSIDLEKKANLPTTYQTVEDYSLKQKSFPTYRQTYTLSGKRSVDEKLFHQTQMALQQNRQKKEPKIPFSLDKTQLVDKDAPSSYPRSYDKCKKPLPLDLSQQVGVGHTQGVRGEDEDYHFCVEFEIQGKKVTMHGVLDGHGDKGICSEAVGHFFPKRVKELLAEQTLNEETITNALTQAIIEADEILTKDRSVNGGTTLTAAFILEDKIYCANVGDSRALLIKNGQGYQLTEDACMDERFTKKLRQEGRLNEDTQRVRTPLNLVPGVRPFAFAAVTRDIGMIGLSPQPKITYATRDSYPDEVEKGKVHYQNGDYLILACDGFWDVATNEEAAAAVGKMAEKGLSPSEIAAKLTYAAFNNGSDDNITVIVIKL